MRDEQLRVCGAYGAEFLAAPSNTMMGLARDFDPGRLPINGLRHPATVGFCGWYVWSGESFSEDPDYFQALHVAHFEEDHPTLAKYLGLAPGWRFLVADGYEDLWFDAQLLSV